ncbi:MAG TPA: tryptophan--tRNA ligase [Nocardioidaceae bacterium]|nr:tryptophan--tRNA ligase [Nocardioidaceae bacterium]
MTRQLSGITPSGHLTLGNHLGALQRFAGGDGTYFVSDLHALTTPHEPTRLRALTRETAMLFLASGIDPERCTVFVQSHVREHAELAYLIESTTYVGELGRMIQFKEKGGRPKTRASLFTYPCLMAADILLYDTDLVPVGGDQDQHVELARDVAIRFNGVYGETFVVPELARAAIGARIADLADPTAKMSKSAPDDAAGVIRMLDDPDVVRRKLMRAVTDNVGEVRYDPERQPGIANLLEILVCCGGDTDPHRLAAGYTSYGELKRDVVDAVTETLRPIQKRYADLAADPGHVDRVLAAGAARASERASVVLRRAQQAMGVG